MEKEKKIFDIRSQLIEYDREKNTMTLQLFDEIDEKRVTKLKYNGKYYLLADFHDERNISDEQRRYFWALMRDYADYAGHLIEPTANYFKLKFMQDKGLSDFPSVARNGMSLELARQFLQFILEYFIDNGVPFKNQEFYLAEDESKLFYALTMNRICWITGKPNAQIAHYEAVGMGRDRTKIDHTKHRVMALSYDLHKEQHKIGWTAFMEKYHVTPIKLNEKDFKELGIRGDYQDPTDEGEGN